jgi:hypothetical protein
MSSVDDRPGNPRRTTLTTSTSHNLDEAVHRALLYLGVASNDTAGTDEEPCYTLTVDLGEGRGICNATFDSASSIWRISDATSLGSTSTVDHHRSSEKAEGSSETHSPRSEQWNEKGIEKSWTDDLPGETRLSFILFPQRAGLTPVDTEHVRIFKSRDWASTLGPMDTWTECLRTMTHKLLVDPRAANLFWYVCLIFINHIADRLGVLIGYVCITSNS